MPGYAYTQLFESAATAMGEYRCTREDPRLSEENHAERHMLILPQSGLMVKHVDDHHVAMDVNTTIFFTRHQVYRVSHPVGCGDRGTTFYVNHDLLLELIRTLDPSVDDQPETPFVATHVGNDSVAYYRHLALLAATRNSSPDPVWMDEQILALFSGAIEAAYANLAPRRTARVRDARSRSATQRAHLETVEAVKAWLSGHYAEPISLSEIARAVACSPYHLCRIFKTRTGLTVHQYLTRLRLRAALNTILETSVDSLSSIAFAHGFSSHSHFTAAFRREFRTTPSKARDDLWRCSKRART